MYYNWSSKESEKNEKARNRVMTFEKSRIIDDNISFPVLYLQYIYYNTFITADPLKEGLFLHSSCICVIFSFLSDNEFYSK